MSDEEAVMRDLHTRHDDHENRLSVVEKQVEVIDGNVRDLRTALDSGFTKIFDHLDRNANDARNERSSIHSRIDDHEKESKITLPIVFAFISTIVVVGTVLVAYVNMAIGPLRGDIIEKNQAMRREMELRSELEAAYRCSMERDIQRLYRHTQEPLP